MATDGKYHYYVKAGENYKSILCRYEIQTKKTKKLLSEVFMYIDEGWIYFSHWNKNQSLYKMKLNGTSLTKLSSQTGVSNINIWGDWVFFEGDYRTLFKVSKDGKTEKKIAPSERFFIAAGGKAYIGGSDGNLSKVSMDGTSYV